MATKTQIQPGFFDFDIVKKLTTSEGYGSVPPTFGDIVIANIGLISVLVFFSIITQVGIYLIWVKIFGKKKAWQAFIPVFNLFKLFQAVNANPYLSFASFVPVLGLFPLFVFNLNLPKAFGIKSPAYVVLSILFPWLVMFIVGLDKKYEYEYIKGKNTPFADSFRVPIPGEAGYDNAITPNEVGAVGSQVSQAAALNAENNRKLQAEFEERKRAEEERAAAELAKKHAKIHAENAPKEVNYDIFDNGITDSGQDIPHQG
ncbi:MAG: DUF5684 domain-containing protein [Candidatus Saccharibacteria bacterium]|nr:DUF5684 domain-containing protein [Candidatus Saccharibacteria bacterium]